jgi:protein phosphatase
MGGALAGEVASRMAVEALAAVAKEILGEDDDAKVRDQILRAIAQANQSIFEASSNNPDQRGMGTTLTAALLREGRVQFFQVGDSKGFIGRKGKLFQMTKDHSLIGQLVDDKVITPEDAEQLEGGRNIILKALGAEETIKIDFSEAPLDEGDVVLLCTDGLHGCVRNRELEEIVGEAHDTGKLCEDLVREARERGGPDNITVVTVTVLEGEEPPPPPGIMDRLKSIFKRDA